MPGSNNELTKREKEVLQYLMEGLNNKEIAEKLMITAHTSKAHVSAILRKFNVKTRTAAVRIGIEKLNETNLHQD